MDDLDVDELEAWQDQIDDWQADLSVAEYRRRLLDAARSMTPGRDGRAELLVSAGESFVEPLGRGGSSPPDLDQALTCFEAARDDGGPTTTEPRIGIVEVLVRQGREDDAADLVRTLRRDQVFLASEGVHWLGELFEELDRLAEAERWFTIGLRDLDPAFDVPTDTELFCLAGRFRVRRRSGKDREDALDGLCAELHPEAVTWMRAGTPPWEQTDVP